MLPTLSTSGEFSLILTTALQGGDLFPFYDKETEAQRGCLMNGMRYVLGTEGSCRALLYPEVRSPTPVLHMWKREVQRG